MSKRGEKENQLGKCDQVTDDFRLSSILILDPHFNWLQTVPGTHPVIRATYPTESAASRGTAGPRVTEPIASSH